MGQLKQESFSEDKGLHKESKLGMERIVDMTSKANQ